MWFPRLGPLEFAHILYTWMTRIELLMYNPDTRSRVAEIDYYSIISVGHLL